jgi:hypothetical protein
MARVAAPVTSDVDAGEGTISVRWNLAKVGVRAVKVERFRPSNNGMQRTRSQRAFYLQSSVRAADPGRYAA